MLTHFYRARTTRKETGFTLIELLVVVIIIGVLAAIALPIFIDQQKVAVDASVKSDVRNTVTNVVNWQVGHQGVAAANSNEYTSVTNGGKIAKSRSNSIIGVKIEANGHYTVCGFNDGGKNYAKAEQAWSFDSASGLFNKQGGATAKCSGAVAADGSDLSTTPIAPAWTSSESLVDGEKGAYYEQNLVASGNPAPTYGLATGAALPAGLTLTPAGVLSGIPTVNGDFTFKVEAKNVKDTATREFKLHLDNTNSIPAWDTNTSLADGKQGTFYSVSLSAPAYPAPVYSLKTGSVLPDGLLLDSTTGVLSGIPSASGNSLFTVIAKNKKGQAERTFFFYAASKYSAPTIATTTLPNPISGASYNQSITSTGAANVTYSINSGSLPAGLTLSAAGAITGTPTATTPISSTFVIKATNADAPTLSSTQSYTVLTHIAPTYTAATGTVSDITGSATTAGSAAVNFGEASISYTLSPMVYPSGSATSTYAVNTTSGAITGTPTVAGTYTFNVTATNTYGSATKAYTVTVTAPVANVVASYNCDAASTGDWARGSSWYVTSKGVETQYYNWNYSTTIKHSGTRSCYVYYPTTDYYANGRYGELAFDNYSYVSGKSYTVSAWVYTSAADATAFTMWRWGSTISGSTTVYSNLSNATNYPKVATGSWQKVDFTFTATGTWNRFLVGVKVPKTSTSDPYIYIDDITITQN